jgi:hypothetical protein
MRSPAKGPDGTYWIAPVPCCGSVTKVTTVPGVKMPPPAGVSGTLKRLAPCQELTCMRPKPVPPSTRCGEKVRPATELGTPTLPMGNCVSAPPTPPGRSPRTFDDQ